MFITDADMTCLRQGDILGNMPFPVMRSGKLSFVGKIEPPTPGSEPAFVPLPSEDARGRLFSIQTPARIIFAAVISQCCDIAPRRGGKIEGQHTIALARLVPLPDKARGDPELLASLRANSNPTGPEAAFLGLFHVPAHAALNNAEWAIDYSQVLCVPAPDLSVVVRRKLLQMTDEARIKFKIKLSYFYGRLTDEEIAMDHEWVRGTT
ncbi:MAG: hypothetical protein WB579_18035 [Bryobacteraceae bacterium]